MSSAVREEAAVRPPVRPNFAWYRAVLISGFVILGAAAAGFARSRHVPLWIALPLTLAFLTEYSFYLLLGFGGIRAWLSRRFGRITLAAGLVVSAFLPYLIASGFTGTFRWGAALCWLALIAATAFWFLRPLRPGLASNCRDLAFLALPAAVILSGVLRWIFPAPWPKLPLEVLGHVTLIRTAILAVLFLRGGPETEIGFVPHWRDVRTGALWFAVCATVATPLGMKLGQLHVSGRTPAFWPSLGLLLGVFWVLALSEEFFFRGLLQQWLSQWTGSRVAGLVLGALLFAACHLGFRGAFPNWRVASLSLILGFCCGAAFLQARSIRASMVTHALAVSAWRLFLS